MPPKRKATPGRGTGRKPQQKQRTSDDKLELNLTKIHITTPELEMKDGGLTKQKLSESRLSCLMGKFHGTLAWTELSDGRQVSHPLCIKTALENGELVINRRITSEDGTTITTVFNLRPTENATVLKGTCSFFPGAVATLQEAHGTNDLLLLLVVGPEGNTRMVTTIALNHSKGTQSHALQQFSPTGALLSVGVAPDLLPTDRIRDAGKMLQASDMLDES